MFSYIWRIFLAQEIIAAPQWLIIMLFCHTFTNHHIIAPSCGLDIALSHIAMIHGLSKRCERRNILAVTKRDVYLERLWRMGIVIAG